MAEYRLCEELGRGGGGTVTRAIELATGREVAIKQPSPEVLSDPRRIRRFSRELETLRRVSHPNVIAILDCGELGGRPFFAMELIRGTDLGRLIRNEGPVPVDRAVRWVAQLAGALVYLHELRLWHRDVKPSNVMLGDGGRVVLMDLGLIKDLELSTLTEEGVLMGTLRFMAPEVMRGTDGGPEQDVWALALTLHELVTGRACYGPASVSSLRRRILDGPPPTLAGASVEVPDWLVELQARALAMRPENRLSALDYRDRLVAGLEEPREVRPRTDAGADLTETPARRRFRAARPWIALALLAALLIAALLFPWPGSR